MSKTLPAATHYAHTHHGYLESQTVAYFTLFGITHVARRFFREDLPTTGKVEIYTVEPGRDPSSAFSEDWLGYAVPGTKSGDAALEAVRAATAARCGDLSDVAERYALIELH